LKGRLWEKRNPWKKKGAQGENILGGKEKIFKVGRIFLRVDLAIALREILTTSKGKLLKGGR